MQTLGGGDVLGELVALGLDAGGARARLARVLPRLRRQGFEIAELLAQPAHLALRRRQQPLMRLVAPAGLGEIVLEAAHRFVETLGFLAPHGARARRTCRRGP